MSMYYKENRILQLLALIDDTKHDCTLYNEVFLPQYTDFRNKCLETMTDDEFGTLWNSINTVYRRCK